VAITTTPPNHPFLTELPLPRSLKAKISPLFLLLLSVFFAFAGALNAALTVTADTDSLAAGATSIIISGTGFDSLSPAANKVLFNQGAIGTVTGSTTTSLIVTFSTPPTSTGNLTAVVTSDDASSGTPVQVATITSALSTYSLLESATGGAGSDSVLLALSSQSTAWSATANASWLHTTSSGTGSDKITFSYDSNPGATRAGTLTIADQTLTVMQAGATYVPAGSLTNLVSTQVSNPCGVAVDRFGNVYIADYDNSVIRKWTAATQALTTLDTTASPLNGPQGIAVDAAGNVYIADSANNLLKMWSVDTNSVSTLNTSASPLSIPVGVALDGSGNVYVTDVGHNAVKMWSPVTQTISTLPIAGLSGPQGVAVDGAGNVYVADTIHNSVKVLTAASQAVSILISSGLNLPRGLALDGSGNVYVADTFNNVIRKWSAVTGSVTNAVTGLNTPFGVAADATGNLYVSDEHNNLVRELPYVFVDTSARSEPDAAGTDALPVVLPSTANLLPPFAPSSDSAWLTIGASSSGVVNFSFLDSDVGSPRTANITLLGKTIAITQAALVAPAGLTYSDNAPIYEDSIAITDNIPSSTGGPVATYSVQPALPTGLTLDATTGIISGTPTVLAAAADYTIKAINNVGNTTTTINITVKDPPPTATAQTLQATTHVPLAITLSATEVITKPTTYNVATQPKNGTLSGTAPNLTYTSAPTFTGTDSFTFKATDDRGDSVPATITIKVFPPVSKSRFYFGHYVGLLTGADVAHSGTITITSTGTGAFTGTMVVGGVTYRLKGIFEGNGQYRINIPRKNLPALTGILNFGLPFGPDVITGTFNGTSIVLNNAIYKTTAPPPQAGRYTVMIPPDSAQINGASAPQGYGVGTLVVAKTGLLTFAGKLADGTKFSQGTALARGGIWYLFIPLYAKGGLLEGTIQFEATAGVSDLDGAVTWIRPAFTKTPVPLTTLYPAGFGLDTHLYGAVYNPKGSLVITPVSANNTFTAQGAGLPSGSLTEPATAGPKTAAIKVKGASGLSLTVSTATGFVMGSFTQSTTSASKTIVTTLPVNAIIYQDGSAPSIIGWFTNVPKSGGTNEAGAVTLTSP